MVLDAVLWNWVMIVAGVEAGPEGSGWVVQWIADFLNGDNKLLASLRSDQL